MTHYLNTVIRQFPSSQMVRLGDFNYPSIVQTRNNPCMTLSSANVLDIVMSNHPDLVSPILHLPGLSDHCLLHFNVKAVVPKPSTHTIQM